MGNTREEILRALRQRARAIRFEHAREEPRHFPDLAARFEQTLRRVKGEVWRAESWPHALEVLNHVLDALEATRIAVNPDPPLDTVDWDQRWPDRTWYVVGRSEGEIRTFCVQADVGISGARVALAETGSVVVGSGPQHSREVTLLPPTHIVLVGTSRLVPDLFAWMTSPPDPLPAALTIISGPSKSADIEQTLAVGVHGPKRFIVILYKDG